MAMRDLVPLSLLLSARRRCCLERQSRPESCIPSKRQSAGESGLCRTSPSHCGGCAPHSGDRTVTFDGHNSLPLNWKEPPRQLRASKAGCRRAPARKDKSKGAWLLQLRCWRWSKPKTGKKERSWSLSLQWPIPPQNSPPVAWVDWISFLCLRRSSLCRFMSVAPLVRGPAVGLVVSSTREPVPLNSVKIHATVKLFAASVVVEQVFENMESKPIEAVYVFPMEESAAIHSFSAQLDDREIVSVLKERKEAQTQYTEALQQGHGAYLLEVDRDSPDMFICSVGALPPHKVCVIRIEYAVELEIVNQSVRFAVPTGVAPRYSPATKGVAFPAGTSTRFTTDRPYKLSFRLDTDLLSGSIAKVSSPSHPMTTELLPDGKVSLVLAQSDVALDRDVVIDMTLRGSAEAEMAPAFVVVEPFAAEGPRKTVAMLSCTPDMSFFDMRLPAERAGSPNSEFVFVVDCSGSMQDAGKIGLAQEAMTLFLKSLPVDCRFNICRFGSSFQTLFPESAVYNEETCKAAGELVHRLAADLGGTELLRPLQQLFSQPVPKGFARQVIVLTDGEISNVEEVLALCRSAAHSTRIFAFGLGQSPSRALVKGLSRATNGRAVFIPPGCSADIAVAEQLSRALTPSLTDVTVDWNLSADPSCRVEQVPRKIPPIFAGDRLLVYGIFDGDVSESGASVTIMCQVGDNRLSQVVAVSKSSCSVAPHGLSGTSAVSERVLAPLAAKRLIQELENEPPAQQGPAPASAPEATGSLQRRFAGLISGSAEMPKAAPAPLSASDRSSQILALSLEYKVLCSQTAFVAVEKRVGGENSTMVLREVPIEISQDNYLASHGTRTPLMLGGGFGALPRMRNVRPSGVSLRAANAAAPALPMSFAAADAVRESSLAEFAPPMTQPAAQERKKTSAEDVVRSLIGMQGFDGSWSEPASEICTLLGLASLEVPGVPDADPVDAATAIVIAFLQIRCAALSMMWKPVVTKATTLLAKRKAADLIPAAESLFRAAPSL